MVGRGAITEVEFLVYLGSISDKEDGTVKIVRSRIDKTRAPFNILKKVWTSKVINNRM